MIDCLADVDAELQRLEELAKLKRENAILFYEPYPKQRDFLNAGSKFIERMLSAGNQVGKSYTGAYETACHLTGLYPDWWTGLRFSKPVRGWAAGPTNELVRDTIQLLLLGQPGIADALGTGLIPKDTLIGEPTKSRGLADAVDTVRVRHVSGGVSVLTFKTYKQERTVWQGATLDFIWFDEEPPMELYSEGQARLIATGGRSYMTFTPMEGMSDVVRRFWEGTGDKEADATRFMIRMEHEDAAHMTPDRSRQTLSVFPEHEWEARRRGLPYFSAGAVFAGRAEDIMEDPIQEVSGAWFKIWGIDFGHYHPFAAVLCAHDRDTDTFHVLQALRNKGELPLYHADMMKRIASNVPVAWPYDGFKVESDGRSTMEIYRSHGLSMIGEPSTNAKTGGHGIEAGLAEMNEAMRTGRFLVNRELREWFNEYRGYHRDSKTGFIVAKNDDLMSATRYAWMMRRRARQVPLGNKNVLNRRRTLYARPINPFTGRPV